MRDRIEADEHVRYVDVSVPGGCSATGRTLLTYHTYDPDLHEGDRVLICAGVLAGEVGTIIDDDCVPPPSIHGNPIYSYRCEAAPEPTIVSIETRVQFSDGTFSSSTVRPA